MTVQSLPVVTVCDGIVTTLSTNVADYFGKLHKDVIRAIESILVTTDSEHKRNFAPMTIDVEIGNGATRKSKAYRLTRDGFTFLAMGFTGAKAQAFKWAYIDAFNKMEAQLRNSTPEQFSEVPTLTPAQQLLVRQAVASRAKIESKNYQTIYRAIYNRFQIARYDQLPQTDLNECLKFIQEVNLNAPEVKHHSEPVVQGQVLLLTPEDCECLRSFIYAFKYLFRKEVVMFAEFLKGVKSPYAGKFYDAATDWSLTNVERILEKCGYPVKELDCYKHWASHQ